jgi:molybdopterin converting factor small subunit
VAGGGTRPAGDPLGRGGGGLTPVVLLPSLLAAEAGGQKRFEVEATTLREALSGLPIANLIFDESGAKRALVNVFVDGAELRDLDTPLATDAEVRIVAAIAGG